MKILFTICACRVLFIAGRFSFLLLEALVTAPPSIMVPAAGRVTDAWVERRPRKIPFTMCACLAVFALTVTSEFELLRGIRTRRVCFLALSAREQADSVFAILTETLLLHI